MILVGAMLLSVIKLAKKFDHILHKFTNEKFILFQVFELFPDLM